MQEWNSFCLEVLKLSSLVHLKGFSFKLFELLKFYTLFYCVGVCERDCVWRLRLYWQIAELCNNYFLTSFVVTFLIFTKSLWLHWPQKFKQENTALFFNFHFKWINVPHNLFPLEAYTAACVSFSILLTIICLILVLIYDSARNAKAWSRNSGLWEHCAGFWEGERKVHCFLL